MRFFPPTMVGMRLDDGNIFKVMRIGGRNNLLTMVHAENGDVIDILVAEALAAGKTAPIHHAHTRPAWGEVEASLRVAALAAQADSPLYLVHMNVAGEVDQLLMPASTASLPWEKPAHNIYSSLKKTSSVLMAQNGSVHRLCARLKTSKVSGRVWRMAPSRHLPPITAPSSTTAGSR